MPAKVITKNRTVPGTQYSRSILPGGNNSPVYGSKRLLDFQQQYPMSSVHLGFDMGIRNLAYCLVRHTDATHWEILAWDNVDLLEGGASAQDSSKCDCGNPAKWIDVSGVRWCAPCATGVRRKKTATKRPSLPVLPCGVAVKGLRALAVEGGWPNAKKAKKEELMAAAATRYLMPWKPTKAMGVSLAILLRAMDTWLNSVLPTFAAATLIRLENQPAMSNPTMKSVQMMLFTLLSHRLAREHGWSSRIEFVHAGVKSRGVTATATKAATSVAADLSGAPLANTIVAGAEYRARKKTAETDAMDLLRSAGSGASRWLSFFEGRTKKSDLADALLMAVRKD